MPALVKSALANHDGIGRMTLMYTVPIVFFVIFGVQADTEGRENSIGEKARVLIMNIC